MADPNMNKRLADKRKEIQAYIANPECDLETARRDLSAIMATEHIFKSRGPNVTAYMELSFLFPRHELPKLTQAALEAAPDGLTAPAIASQIIAAKGLNETDNYLRRAIGYKLVQVLRRWEKMGTTIVWRLTQDRNQY